MLYTFYGDDFTGSTDVLEQLGSNNIPAVLFLGPPSPAHLAAFSGVQAIGIAGDSRSRSPEWMSKHLPAIFRTLQQFNAPITHYKVCSTFDSSPTTGSIGRAIEIGLEVFHPAFVPIVVGAPHLRRYVAFGNLFASDHNGIVQRIDRHPMSHHPVTPMHEADLRLHLAAQTRTKFGLIDIPTLESSTISETVAALVAATHSAIVFDTVDTRDQSTVGAFLWIEAQQHSIFAAGSSGLTAALISAWNALGILADPPKPEPLTPAKPLLIVSGSCSERTNRQIRHALAHGFHGIPLDPAALTNPDGLAHAAALEAASQSLAAGHDTVLYTALGPTETTAHGAGLGTALGILVRDLLSRTTVPISRVMLCGGDTSSHAVQQLGLYALTWAANLQPGVPLCRAHSDDPLHHLELILKGGQVGTDDFFPLVRG
jgi:3-oxoisoapionate kinase